MLLKTVSLFERKFRNTIIINPKLKFHRSSKVSDKVSFFNTPERFKGTFVETWINYWKNLYIDYSDVAQNIYQDVKLHPIKATIYSLIGASCYYSAVHTPDETDFRQQLVNSALKLSITGELIRNPISVFYVKWLEQCHNEGILRYQNLGLFSIVWLDNYDRGCGVYKATCSYLKPRYITFYQRIVDVGFLDNWWILESSMHDYDINDTEHLQNLLAENKG